VTDKNFFKLSLIPVIFFAFFYSVYLLKLNTVFFGVIQELLYIPMLGFLAGWTIWSFIRVFLEKEKRTKLSLLSIALLSITTALIINSFL